MATSTAETIPATRTTRTDSGSEKPTTRTSRTRTNADEETTIARAISSPKQMAKEEEPQR